MKFDLVFPRRNEHNLANMAARLGVRELLLCYPLKEYSKELEKEAKNLSKTVECSIVIFCKNQQEVQKARHLKLPIVCKGAPGIHEDKRVQYLINFESSKRKDFMHHRNSGLTQVFIKKGANKTFLVNLNQLLTADDPATILGRIQQNNRMFKKYKSTVRVVSGATQPLEMRALKDLQNFLNI